MDLLAQVDPRSVAVAEASARTSSAATILGREVQRQPPLPVLLARRRTLVYCKSKWRCESRFVETACGSRVERPTHKLSKLH